MMLKTHTVMAIAAALLLITQVKNPFIFFIIAVIAGVLPDMDIAQSKIGKKWYFRPVQLLAGHRGLFHSFLFCLLLSIVFTYISPVLGLPVFLGYSVHLIADSFTLEGIKPFWPMKDEVKGKVRVGGPIEEGIFVIFCILDVILLIRLFL
jgi:inner membrane protein